MCLYIKVTKKNWLGLTELRKEIAKTPTSSPGQFLSHAKHKEFSKRLKKDFAHVAEKDIKVFKVFRRMAIMEKSLHGGHNVLKGYNNNVLISPIRHTNYAPGGTYDAEFGIHFGATYISQDMYFAVEQGLHSYAKQKTAIMRHSLDAKDWPGTYVIVEAVIPKGTHYFIGKDGDLVSEKLKLLKKRPRLLSRLIGTR